METAPQEIFDLTLAKKTENEKELENAYRRIPDEYHDFIVLLEQKIKITDSKIITNFILNNSLLNL